jgi:hypothetical protein
MNAPGGGDRNLNGLRTSDGRLMGKSNTDYVWWRNLEAEKKKR